MIGINGYLTPQEVDQVRSDLAASIINDSEIIARDIMDPDSKGSAVFTKRWKSEDSGTVKDFIYGTARMIQLATPVLWRTDLWRSAISGSETFRDVPFDPSVMRSPLELHIPAASQAVSMNDGEEPKEALMAALLVKDSASTGGSGDSEGIYLTLFRIPFVPLGVDASAYKPDEDWVRMRSGYITAGTKRDDGKNGEAACLVMALLEFMHSPYISMQEFGPDRAERRRAKREGKSIGREKTIRVVCLRRRERDKDAPSSEIDWSCQWTVAGHWRNQWYPSEKKHHPKYIGTYLKGPEDKPLKPPAKTVYHVNR